MTDCCENGAAFETPLAPVPETHSRIIHFAAMSPERQQAFTDYLQHGHNRHMADIRNIEADLAYIKERWGIVPSEVYLCKEAIWHEVRKELKDG